MSNIYMRHDVTRSLVSQHCRFGIYRQVSFVSARLNRTTRMRHKTCGAYTPRMLMNTSSTYSILAAAICTSTSNTSGFALSNPSCPNRTLHRRPLLLHRAYQRLTLPMYRVYPLHELGSSATASADADPSLERDWQAKTASGRRSTGSDLGIEPGSVTCYRGCKTAESASAEPSKAINAGIPGLRRSWCVLRDELGEHPRLHCFEQGPER